MKLGMRLSLLTCAGLSMGLVACAEAGPTETPAAAVDSQGELGSLSLHLVGADSDGRAYRLRQAEFEIYSYGDYGGLSLGVAGEENWSADGAAQGPQSPGDAGVIVEDGGIGIGDGDDGGDYFFKTVSSETDLSSTTITERVVPGLYQVSLGYSAWFLERLEGGEWTRVEKAILLSSRYQWVSVFHAYTSRVAFRFGVDGDLIDFRAGNIEIGIEIEQPGEGPGESCDNPWPMPLPWPCGDGDGDNGGDGDGDSADGGIQEPGFGDGDATPPDLD